MSVLRAKLAGMRLRLALLPILLTVILIVACGGDDDGVERTATADDGTAGAQAISPGRIYIPSIDVEARLTSRQLVVWEPLPSPEGTRDVAIYDFGSERSDLGGTPGEGGNVVLSGHSLGIVGCEPAEPPCNAVFSGLRRVAAGSAVDLNLQGRLLQYQVVAMCNLPTLQFNDELYRRTTEEQSTLLTGAGNWNSEVGWSHVLIVIAKPAPRTAFEACPQGTFTGRP